MILGQAGQRLLPPAIDADITDPGQQAPGLRQPHQAQGAAEGAARGFLLRELMQLIMHGEDHILDLVHGIGQAGLQRHVLDRVRKRGTGHIAGIQAAHAVDHGPQAFVIQAYQGIFILRPAIADVGRRPSLPTGHHHRTR